MLTMVGAYVHSLKIRVSAEGVQKQQHQVKDEAVLLLLEDETLQNVKSIKLLHATVNRTIDLPTNVGTLPGF